MISGTTSHAAGTRGEPSRQRESGVARRSSARHSPQVDDPAGALEEARERAVRGLRPRSIAGMFQRDAGRKTPCSSRSHSAPAGLSTRSASALMHRSWTLDAGALRRQRAREAQPLLAIVVAIREEMLADEDAELRAEAPRRGHEHGEQQRGEQKLDLQRAAPVAAEDSGRSSRPRRRASRKTPDTSSAVEWKTAPRDMCSSIVQPGLRAVATARNGMTSAVGDAARDPDVGVEAAEQHRVGVEEEVEGEERRRARRTAA